MKESKGTFFIPVWEKKVATCESFGKRYYDPEVGVWISTDPKEQLFNPYAYSPDPLNTIDPDGQWIGSLLAAATWYITAVISNYGEFNPGKWNWDDPGLVMSTFFTLFYIGADIGNDIANLAKRSGTATFAEDGSSAKYTELESRAPNSHEEKILNDFYSSDNEYMNEVRNNWNNMSEEQRIAALREGIQDYDLLGIPGKDVSPNGYKLGPIPYKDSNGNYVFKSTTKGNGLYVDHIHSHRLSNMPSGLDFSNVRFGNNYYLLHNPVSGSPSIIQYGKRGFLMKNYVQPIKITF